MLCIASCGKKQDRGCFDCGKTDISGSNSLVKVLLADFLAFNVFAGEKTNYA